MRTISWKHPLIALFAAAVVAACSSDSTPGPTADASPEGSASPCGNGTIDKGEDCDGTKLGGMTCMSVMMGTKPNGMLGCSKTTCKFDTSKCTGAGGGGAGGGGAGGSSGTGGGPGGTGNKDGGGPDSGPETGGAAGSAGGAKPDAGGGKPDSGGGKPDATVTPPAQDAATD